MASTNQSPFYKRAEEEFFLARTDEERIACLEVMIKECPKHKSSENMLRNLTNRYKKLKESVERKNKTAKGGGQQGIKKSDMQCVLFGFPNVGKSELFNILTEDNPNSKVTNYPYTTSEPIIGSFDYEDVKVQIIDDASIPNQNKSIINVTDTLLIIFNDLEQLVELEKLVWKSTSKKIYVLNKIDLYSEGELRKIKATIKSKYKNFDVVYFQRILREMK